MTDKYVLYKKYLHDEIITYHIGIYIRVKKYEKYVLYKKYLHGEIITYHIGIYIRVKKYD